MAEAFDAHGVNAHGADAPGDPNASEFSSSSRNYLFALIV